MRHRLAGKPDRPVRGRTIRNAAKQRGTGAVHVQVQVTDFATLITQSFLILPDQPHRAVISGIVQGPGDYPRVVTLPITITARVA
jgi:hypothetical protein